MKIGLYFGSFNPIHIGHMIIAEHVVNNSDLKQVWFVLSPHNPLKSSNTLLNEYDRLHLLNIAIDDNERFRAMDVEFKLPKPSYTITTLVYLEEKYPQHEFVIVIGSDSFTNLSKWKNYETLIKNYSFIVYRRPGFEINTETTKNINYELLDAPLLDISATFIRAQLKERKDIKYLLPHGVYSEIESNKYYL
ncbi:nicotinate (nicotinamide) nucleotide adenylyltransferase [Arachidicoccus soli]|uniref:Probable nicotinate-nucleotide adenylyltransferase n=1 Tax=Arachidicoccus soli TaxID=2341117 RepID=A0A386HV61_9BACT|nr:nicotinate (nicotinamide) nucleotide adenylyltransferase [Arachidicoccus soli]AYD49486.1 nicotinate-nucleotide adenylyltransferase [Arachidicoccus soli]